MSNQGQICCVLKGQIMENDNKDLEKKLNERLFDTLFDEKITEKARLNKIEYLIRLGADKNARAFEVGNSLLVVAYNVGKSDVVEFLKKNEAKEIYPSE